MKILAVNKSGPLLVTPIGNRLYKVGADISVNVCTDIGMGCLGYGYFNYSYFSSTGAFGISHRCEAVALLTFGGRP